jgi:tRNA(fMet)-specific endonuclease VapC
MKRYMLDTNIVGHLLKQHPVVTSRVVAASMAALCVSVITVGELLFGLAKRPQATHLHAAVRAFLQRVDTLFWDNSVAQQYGPVRAALQAQGTTLAPLDLLIAAHAMSIDAVLVTNDQAFGRVPNLRVEDWTL